MSERRTKKCVDCGKSVTRRATRCLSCSSKKVWNAPKYRQKIIEKATEGLNRPEVKKKIGEKAKERFSDPDYLEWFKTRVVHNPATGKDNHFWKGGKTPENQLIRQSTEYKQWREIVFERDNYTCQKCGIKGGNLQAHHIRNFADYPDLRFTSSNGITYCLECHSEIEGRPIRKNRIGNRKEPCPDCGNPKIYTAKRCRKCAHKYRYGG